MLVALLAAWVAQPGPSTKMTAQEDHRLLLLELGIAQLRPGVNGMDPKAPNFANTDESKANPFHSIPELLKFDNGKAVRTRGDWQVRRKEILEHLDREIYGRIPTRLPSVRWELTSTESGRIGDSETETKRWTGHVDNRAHPALEVNIRMSLTLPEEGSGKVPVMMEFGSGSSGRRPGAFAPPAPSWQKLLIEQGWGFAILEPATVQADHGGGLVEGIIGLANLGHRRKPDDWGALKAWAWGASRALDCLVKDRRVDPKRVGIEGLSRYGKAALVAMAYEPRFAIGFVGSSGQGGAKIWRRNFGETVENVASSGEYHWMAGNYVRYAGPLMPNDMPVDAHHLIALCAPRPLFVGVGSLKVEGIWIDPAGTFMATHLASPAWELLGARGLGSNDMPPEGTPLITGDLAYSQHNGGHTNEPNWPTFIAFANRTLKVRAPR